MLITHSNHDQQISAHVVLPQCPDTVWLDLDDKTHVQFTAAEARQAAIALTAALCQLEADRLSEKDFPDGIVTDPLWEVSVQGA